MTKILFKLSIRTLSEANCSEHWSKKHKRHKEQQFYVRWALLNHFKDRKDKVNLPCTVKMIRMAPRSLDSDNLVSSFKWIRDEISECLFQEKKTFCVLKSGKIKQIKGRLDSDPRITWLYDQEKSKLYWVRIEIEF